MGCSVCAKIRRQPRREATAGVLLNSEENSSGKLAEILKALRSKISPWLANNEGRGLASSPVSENHFRDTSDGN